MLPTLLMIATLSAPPERDAHSHANPEQVRVTHADLDMTVEFEKKQLNGTATLTIERVGKNDGPLILDTNGLTIAATEISDDGKTFAPATFKLGEHDPILGKALSIPLNAATKFVRVTYTTGPKSNALQWLSPLQTAGKKAPYLFTQSQAIDARSWVPIQDTPGVRFTYAARVRTPKDLRAVMSAGNDPAQARTGDYRFEMKQPIPAYLLALAVGDIEFRKLGPRTGVYGEPSVVGKAALEFAELEEMVRACEKLYGPYRWERYDVLVMPPSFPFGGMENPRLTFASPTVLAGDKSLVSLLAHELAHSWSGNLVTNATWRDFWLNEGFTVYLERRIMEEVYGKARAEAEAVLGKRSLERELAELPKDDQILHINLSGRQPVDGLTDVPYEKGALFLKHLEAVYGRAKLDAFLKKYFDHFAFKSITTAEFKLFLHEHLLKGDEAKAKAANIEEWLHSPGLPKDAPNPSAGDLTKAEATANDFASGKLPVAQLPVKGWTPQQWLHFLNTLPNDLKPNMLAVLDERFHLTLTGNSELLFQWLLLSIRHGYAPAMERLEGFLTEQGRRKFLKPLYEELMKSKEGRERAMKIYRKARPGYHPISIDTIDTIVGWKE